MTTCCGGDVAIRAKGPHYGEYCAGCGSHLRWVPKSELGIEQRSVQSSSIKPKVRALVLDRHDHACISCGRRAPDVILHVDHIIPTELAKRHDLYDELIDSDLNLAPYCEECNLGKGCEVFTASTARLMYRCLRIASSR